MGLLVVYFETAEIAANKVSLPPKAQTTERLTKFWASNWPVRYTADRISFCETINFVDRIV